MRVIIFFLLPMWMHAQNSMLEIDDIIQLIQQNPKEGRKVYLDFIDSQSEIDSGIFNNVIATSYAIEGMPDSAIHYFNIALPYIDSTDFLLPHVLYNKASLHRIYNDLRLAYLELTQAKNIAIQQENDLPLALIYAELSSVLSLLDRNKDAIDNILKAIEIFEALGNQENNISISKQKLANLYIKSKDFEFSKKIYDELLPQLQKDDLKSNYIISLVNYIEIIQNLYGSEAAIENAFEVYETYFKEDIEEFLILPYILLNARIANLYEDRGLYKDALFYYQITYDYLQKNISTYTLKVLNQYADFLINTMQYKQLINLYDFIEENFDENKFPLQDVAHYYRNKAKIASLENDFQKSNIYLNKVIDINAKFKDLQSEILFIETKEKFQNNLLLKQLEIIEKQSEIAQKQSEIAQKKLYNFLLISTIVLLIALFSLYINTSRKVQYKKENMLLKEKYKVQKKLEATQQSILDNQKHDLEEAKELNLNLNRKLTAFNKMLKKKDQSKDLLEEFNKLQIGDDNWNQLFIKFKLAEREFFSKFMAKYPQLTQNDLEFCALIRMGFSFKNIAQILNISHSSVSTKKYRLMKKLGLDRQKIDFISWIMEY